jgi:hypothetical protein
VYDRSGEGYRKMVSRGHDLGLMEWRWYNGNAGGAAAHSLFRCAAIRYRKRCTVCSLN